MTILSRPPCRAALFLMLSLLATHSAHAADGAKYSESWKEKLTCQKLDNTDVCGTSDSGKFKLSATAPIEADIAAFGPATPVRVSVGDKLLFDGVLGDDPDYVAGETSAEFPLQSNTGTLKLQWKATSLKLSASGQATTTPNGAGAPILAAQFEDQATSALNTTLCAVVLLGEISLEFPLTVTGKASTKPKSKGGRTFPLSNVSLKGTGLPGACQPPLVALPGQDQNLLPNEKVILTAAASNAVGPVNFAWSVLSKPPGSAVTITNPAAAVQLIAPDSLGEYALGLQAIDGPRTSDVASISLVVSNALPPDPDVVAVTEIEFTEQAEGLVDPASQILVSFMGAVDSTSLTTNNVQLTRDGSAVNIALDFDAPAAQLRITPSQELQLGSTYQLVVSNLTSLVTPFVATPFSRTFLTPTERASSVGGVVLTPEREPLPFVTMRIAGQETLTDDKGQFFFRDVPPGTRDLDIDPSTVEGDIEYAPLHYILEVKAGARVNSVGRPIIMTLVDTAGDIEFPGETVLSNPNLPGLVIDFTGCILRNPHDLSAYQGRVNLSPVGPANVPMPFPGPGLNFWTIQPGGLFVDPPAKITVPLPTEMTPGDQVRLWAFDHANGLWVDYGAGQVNSNGLTATSLPGQGVPFTGWHAAITQTEVVRIIGQAPAPGSPALQATLAAGLAGTVVDADDHPLHGVKIEVAGGPIIYTDYQNVGGSNVLDGTIDGGFVVTNAVVGYNVSNTTTATFIRFQPSNVVLRVTACDLEGNHFTKSVTVDIVSLANTTVPGGGLPTIITPPNISPIKLDNFKVVDAQKHIHPLFDYGDLDNAHRIKPRPANDRIAQTTRYRATMAAVTRKLASLGFRENRAGDFLNESNTMTPGSAAHRALRLYLTVWTEGGLSAAFNTVEPFMSIVQLPDFNNTEGVIWTSNDPFVAENNYPYNFANHRLLHGTIPRILKALPTANVINDASPANGGQRCCPFYGETHFAGSEIDVKWLKPNGTPGGSGNFYRPLQITAGTNTLVATVTLSSREVPEPSEEFTDEDRAAGVTEEDAMQFLGRTWRTREDYSRANTRAYIAELQALQPSQVVYNDPQITGVSRVPRHANHIHVGYRFKHTDVQPVGTDGAPTFSIAGAPAGLTVTALDPGDTSLAVDPARPIIVQFSHAVAATSLPGNVRLKVFRNGTIVPCALQLDASGQQLEIIPNQDLPENESFILELTTGITDTLAQPLQLTDGNEIVAAFATGLSLDRDTARIEPDPIVLSRSNLTPPALRVLGGSGEDVTRDVTASAEFVVVSARGQLIEDAVDENLQLRRVANGRSVLTALLNNGVTAARVINASFTADPTLPVRVDTGDPLPMVFEESVNVPNFQAVAARVRNHRNEVFDGTFTFSGDGRTVTFIATNALPRFLELRLEVDLRARDNSGQTLVVITSAPFKVVGVEQSDVDTDEDGLPDIFEASIIDCIQPDDPDTDDDGITDDREDCDGDGLTNAEELALLTDPGDNDTDNDGAPDWAEVQLGCDPIASESATTATGRVLDAADQPVANVSVRVGTGTPALTDGSGNFTLANVPGCLPFHVVATLVDDGLTFRGGSIVTNPTPGGVTAVGDIPLRLAGLTLANQRFVIGGEPLAMELVDVDGNTTLDLVVANEDTDDVSILLGDGAGGFSPHQQFAVGEAPQSIEVGDVDEDGNLDVITANRRFSAGSVSLLLGNGDGTFAAATSPLTTNGLFDAVLGDLNGDTNLDLVVSSCINPGLQGVWIALGNGNGTFQTFQPRPFGCSGAIALADLNNDQLLDLVSVGASIAVLLGNGDGTFQDPATFAAAGGNPFRLAVADVNHDNALDVVTVSGEILSVSLGFGDGTLSNAVGYAAGDSPLDVVLADLNSDGNLDMVTANIGDDTASVLLGNSNGTFQAQQSFITGEVPLSVAAGDVDGDNDIDVFTGDSSYLNVTFLPGNGDGTLRSVATYLVGDGPVDVRAGLINSDAIPDVVTLNRTAPDVSVLRGVGDGSFLADQLTTLSASPRDISLRLGFLDGDNNEDAILLTNNGIVVLRGNASGTLTLAPTQPIQNQEELLELGDFDNDGELDLVTLRDDEFAEIRLGNGNATFQAPVTNAVTDEFHLRLLSRDIDRDGDDDVVLVTEQDDDLYSLEVLRSLGNGSLQFYSQSDIGRVPADAQLADFNGDGFPDAALATETGELSVLLAAGNGGFAAPQHNLIGSELAAIAIGDFNSDNLLDVATIDGDFNELEVSLGRGDGTFDDPLRFNTGNIQFPPVLAVVDLNGDSLLDVILTGRDDSPTNDTIRVLLQE